MQPRRDKNANAQHGWTSGNRGHGQQHQHQERGQQPREPGSRDWSTQERFFSDDPNEPEFRGNEYRGGEEGDWRSFGDEGGGGQYRGGFYSGMGGGPYGGMGQHRGQFGMGGQHQGGHFGMGGEHQGGGQFGGMGGQYRGGQYGGGQGTTGGQYGMGGQYQGGPYGSGGYWGGGGPGEGIQRLFGKGPKGYSRSDERIKEDLCDRLMHMPDLDSSDVEVSVSGGEVTLTGTIPDRSMKYRVEHVADQIGGVKDISNQLKVRRGQERESRDVESSTMSGNDQPDRKRPRS